MRMFTTKLRNGSILVDDSYNANLESMTAMLDVSQELIAGKMSVGLIIGDMLELGNLSKESHIKIAEMIKAINPAFCFCVGSQVKVIFDLLSKNSIKTALFDKAELVSKEIFKNDFDVLMLKGSRGIKLDLIAEEVIKKYGVFE